MKKNNVKSHFLAIFIALLWTGGLLAEGTENEAVIQSYSHEYGVTEQIRFLGPQAKHIFDLLSNGSARQVVLNRNDLNFETIRLIGRDIRCDSITHLKWQIITYSCFSRLYWGQLSSGEEIPEYIKPDGVKRLPYSTSLISANLVIVKIETAYEQTSFEINQFGHGRLIKDGR